MGKISEIQSRIGTTHDPLGRWNVYASASCEDVDWILKHILNCSMSNITELKEALVENKNDEMTSYMFEQIACWGSRRFGIRLLWVPF